RTTRTLRSRQGRSSRLRLAISKATPPWSRRIIPACQMTCMRVIASCLMMAPLNCELKARPQPMSSRALSMAARSANARELIKQAGSSAPLIAKIEKAEAIDHLDEIIAVADGVMVARGDLGVETS